MLSKKNFPLKWLKGTGRVLSDNCNRNNQKPSCVGFSINRKYLHSYNRSAFKLYPHLVFVYPNLSSLLHLFVHTKELATTPTEQVATKKEHNQSSKDTEEEPEVVHISKTHLDIEQHNNTDQTNKNKISEKKRISKQSKKKYDNHKTLQNSGDSNIEESFTKESSSDSVEASEGILEKSFESLEINSSKTNPLETQSVPVDIEKVLNPQILNKESDKSQVIEDSTNSEKMETTTEGPKVIYRDSYKPYPFTITDTTLFFDIYPENTFVKGTLKVKKNEYAGEDLVLDAVEMEIKKLEINGNELLEGTNYKYENEEITIFAKDIPEGPFEFQSEVVIHPEKNFALTGLYKSASLYVTQCESTGFRHITPYIDRPDIMAKFLVTICADKSSCPVLLSNGDKIEEYDIENGRHCATFSDYYSKPSYLFGLVAGDLEYLKEDYITGITKKKVELYVYSEKKHVTKLQWALESLKKSMRFDEEYFHLEYDLKRLNLVAVSDFNMGAMENKGLNIFNVNSLLTSKKTSTDASYERILTVVSHEYFHNWTGNRVTLRDWFQLTLKEGLTVFREHLFSQQAIKSDTFLLDTVEYIRTVQFMEDSSPIAHPIRPDSYVSMDNFYTPTVYEKGSQVMRMYKVILGEEYYKKGLQVYIKTNDGKGATCEDMNYAMEKVYQLKKGDKNASLEQYMLWYSQSGTPIVTASYSYDEKNKTFHITLNQETKPTSNQTEKHALFIPVNIGLIHPQNGEELLPTTTLELTKKEQVFSFENIPIRPLPSVLREFSAPVRIEDGLTREEKLLLIKFDSDSFVKYNASVDLYKDLILRNYNIIWKATNEKQDKYELEVVPSEHIEAIRYMLGDKSIDYGVKSYMLKLPTDKFLMGFIEELDTDILSDVKLRICKDIVDALGDTLFKLFVDLEKEAEDATHFDNEKYVDFDQMNVRKLRNSLLHLLSVTKYPGIEEHIKKHAQSLYPTNKLFSLLVAAYTDEFYNIYDKTYEFVKDEELLLEKWLSHVSLCQRDDIFDIIERVQNEILKNTKNPNFLRSVYYVFSANTKYFNIKTGRGYKLLADAIINMDSFNRQLAAQLTRSFSIWTKLNKERQNLMVKEMERILEVKTLSKDVKEFLMRLLNKL